MPETVHDCSYSVPKEHDAAFTGKCKEFAAYFMQSVALTQAELKDLRMQAQQLTPFSVASEIARLFTSSQHLFTNKVSFYAAPNLGMPEAMARIYYLNLAKEGVCLRRHSELLEPGIFANISLDALKKAAVSLYWSARTIINQ